MGTAGRADAHLSVLGYEWVIDGDGARRRYLVRRWHDRPTAHRDVVHYVQIGEYFCYACLRDYGRPIGRCMACGGILASAHEVSPDGHQ